MESPISKNILKRHSIRSFRLDDIPEKDLEAIISAGLIAPSSKNRQPWQIIVIRDSIKRKAVDSMRSRIESDLKNSEDDDYKRDLKSALRTMDILDQVPVALAIGYVDRVPYRNAKKIGGYSTDRILVDTLSIGACIENMTLEAAERGIGSLWIGDHLYAEKELESALGVSFMIVSMVALGYPESPVDRQHARADGRVTYL